MKVVISILLALSMALCFAACGKQEAPTDTQPVYQREDPEQVYDHNLSDFRAQMKKADTEQDGQLRLAALAQAESILIEDAVAMPLTGEAGTYRFTRIVPHTAACPQWGGTVYPDTVLIAQDPLTAQMYAELNGLWEDAMKSGDVYDPAAYLKQHGITTRRTCSTVSETVPGDLDWLAPNADSRLFGLTRGAVYYDEMYHIVPGLAEMWEMSDDGTEYTFHIRSKAKWYTAKGTAYAPATAADFADGLYHALQMQPDCTLADGIVGAADFRKGKGLWEDVGYKATDDSTLTVTLSAPDPDFIARMASSLFLPVCSKLFRSAEQFAPGADLNAQVYCGAYLPGKCTDTEFTLNKNNQYYGARNVRTDTLKWVVAENAEKQYKQFTDGTYTEIPCTEEICAVCGADYAAKYQVAAPLGSTTRLICFNLDRMPVESKTPEQQISTHNALQSRDFRKAILFALNKEVGNGVGKKDPAADLRNLFDHPAASYLTRAITEGEAVLFGAGTSYGELVQSFLTAVHTRDGVNGWYSPENALSCMENAVTELGDTVSYPVMLDLAYCPASLEDTALAVSVKKTVEENLGTDRVQIALTEVAAPENAVGFDLCIYPELTGDLGDPAARLRSFLPGGSMIPFLGLS